MKKLTLLMILIFMLFGAQQVHEASMKEPVHVWTTEDSKAYAHDVVYEWADNQFACLEKLWTKESNWRPEAYNDIKVMGKNAGGIPQMLGMSPNTPPTQQIERGFKYIMYRYGTPCKAWRFHQKNGWY
jgi:hypothetical protein